MSSPAIRFRVGLGSCGLANGARPVFETLEREVATAGAGEVKSVGCGGLCHREPLVEVLEDDRVAAVYTHVSVDGARQIARRHLRPARGGVRARWWFDRWRRGGADGDAPELCETAGAEATPRIVLENCGIVDPRSLDDAVARGAYEALRACLDAAQPDRVVETILESGLRGRGGAGFPTGRKWKLARQQPPGPRVVICNGDEGDPGAFMDRLILESDPHRVIEGLAIAAFAVGAGQGIFYIRAEYPQAVRNIRHAIHQAEQAGWLGQEILGSGFDLTLEVREGAGAFVCGEETALIASLEGRRGMPRLRPPYPVERGLHDRPTVINNVETLACVPWIVRHGAKRFAELGTATSNGTKVFALAGKIRHGGLIEVPMGITLRRIVDDLGGGVPDGRALKAVQLGGPSGGCLPASLAETPVDYEALADSGAIMGSGGLVALDDRDCMVDMARFFLRFTCDESCGKCTFCRVGTRRMLEILDRLCDGLGRPEDLANLEELADRVSRNSLCGLGQTAPNPVATALRYFREEFEVHVREKRCPAGRCAELVQYRINEACIGCTMCAQVCPVDAIEYLPHRRHAIDEASCTRCDQCFTVCQDGAVEIVSADRVAVTSPVVDQPAAAATRVGG